MQQDLPTGLPFYLERNALGEFDFKIAGDRNGWSVAALHWLNYMSYDEQFKRPDGTYFPLKCALTSEEKITVGGTVYTVDGVVQTEDEIFFLEFFGCRFSDSKLLPAKFKTF